MPLYVFTDEPCEVGDTLRSGHRVLAVLERVPLFSRDGAKKRCLLVGSPAPLAMTLLVDREPERRTESLTAPSPYAPVGSKWSVSTR